MYKDILVDEAQELMAANLVSCLSLKLDGLMEAQPFQAADIFQVL